MLTAVRVLFDVRIGSYTADYTDKEPHKQKARGGIGKAADGHSVEEKSGKSREDNAGGFSRDAGGRWWVLGRVVWDALVLLVGVAIGVCAARAYGGYERRGEYQPIDRA